MYIRIISLAVAIAGGAIYNVALIANQPFNVPFIILTVIIGVFCCIFQFKQNKHNE